MKPSIFLSARWEYLAMLNYKVDAAVLLPHIPPGTELDLWDGKAMVSLVGFLFNDTRVLGVRWPFFTHFEEVNLRYYVKQPGKETDIRGVGFVSEIVPRFLIAKIANTLYNEHYRAMPMKHNIQIKGNELNVAYQWNCDNKWQSLSVTAQNTLRGIMPGSGEEFILEHYYGFNGLNDKTSIAYGVEHPRWEVYPVISWSLDADIARLYGKEFAPFIQSIKPESVFLARGSDIIVRKPVKIYRV